MSDIIAPELAGTAAEAVRALNHATHPHSPVGALEYPADVYDTVAALKQLTQRLPQTFTQLGGFLETQHAAGYMTADHGTPEEHAAAVHDAFTEAADAAEALTSALDRAHNALAPLGYAT